MNQLEAAAREVVELARRLDFYAAWVPMLDTVAKDHKSETVRGVAKEFGEAIWKLRDRLGDYEQRIEITCPRCGRVNAIILEHFSVAAVRNRHVCRGCTRVLPRMRLPQEETR